MLGKLNSYVTRIGLFLIVAALLAGMAGCTTTSAVEIRDWWDLDAIRDNLAGSYILMNDLDSTTPGYEELAGPDGNEGWGWLPIGTEDDAFTGSLDGQGYEIRDLIVGDLGAQAGVFGFIDEGGQIENIGVVDVHMHGSEIAGGLAAVCHGIVSNSYSIAYVGGGGRAGGLVGICNGTVSNSYSIAHVVGGEGVGGLVGICGGTVTNSYSTGDVMGDSAVGGLAGVCSGAVTNSHSTATVHGREDAGGLVGICNGTVANSYSTGNVSGDACAGGLVGWNWNEGTVSNSYSTGNVTGNFAVGGLVGVNEGTVTKSYAMGTVTCSEVVAGGLVGINEGTVTASHSAGSVTGDMEVGGLVGINGWYMNGYSNPGTVTSSYSTGTVAGRYDVGGLIGGNGWESIVSDSYATGNVSGDDCAGGLVGTNVGAVEDSYSTGNVTGNSSVGGLVGDDGYYNNGTASDSFWDIQTSGQLTSDGGIGKNTTEMQDIATFSGAGWNITAVALNETNLAYIWNIIHNVTYPFLSWQM